MLRICDLKAGYDKHTVLRGVSFELEKGHILGLLGRNGCGKTTLFKCINGFLKPFSGSIFLDGKDASDLTQRELARLAAFVPQATSAVFSIPVREMILLGSSCRIKAWEKPGISFEQEAEGYAEELGISSLLDKQFNEISGGEQQLVLIARALMQNAAVLLLDEPTSHLDFANTYMIMDMIEKLAQTRQITVVITAHDPNLVIDYCTDVIMLKDGLIMTSGAAEDVMTESNLKALYGESIILSHTDTGPVVQHRKGNGHDL